MRWSLRAGVVLAGSAVALALSGCSDSAELGDLVNAAAEQPTTTSGSSPTTTASDTTTTAEGGTEAATTTTVGGSDVSVFELAVGDCFDDATGAQVQTVVVLPCDAPHDNEVFALFDIEGDVFPGDVQVAQLAEQGCIERFEDFVGVEYAASVLEVSFLYPLQEGWEQIDDREVVCIAFRADGGSLDRSVRGSGM